MVKSELVKESVGSLAFLGVLSGIGLFATAVLIDGAGFLIAPAMLLLLPSLLYGLR